MNILFHTIAAELARWTSQQVSRLLPRMAAHRFHYLEASLQQAREEMDFAKSITRKTNRMKAV